MIFKAGQSECNYDRTQYFANFLCSRYTIYSTFPYTSEGPQKLAIGTFTRFGLRFKRGYKPFMEKYDKWVHHFRLLAKFIRQWFLFVRSLILIFPSPSITLRRIPPVSTAESSTWSRETTLRSSPGGRCPTGPTTGWVRTYRIARLDSRLNTYCWQSLLYLPLLYRA